MDTFSLLLDIVVALGAALTLGLLLARAGQNAVVGYLLAGVLIGPHGLGLLQAVSEVRSMAELGVALLLFTIGLELPWARLRALGTLGAAAGLLQIVVTAVAVTGIAAAVGVSPRQGAVVGTVVAFSSTAVVFRVLADRAEIDSVAGRVSVGILLVQDVAVVPCLLLLPALAGAGEGGAAGAGTVPVLMATLGRGALLIGAIYLLARTLLPVLVAAAAAAHTRELFVILALTFCLGATWAAHALHLSPVLGAFVAGVVMADSRFASQIRVEVHPLRAGFLVLFFVSIGMLADPGWIWRNLVPVTALILAVVAAKGLITALVVRVLGYTAQIAIIAAATLAHIGELSFVVAEVGREYALLTEDAFRLVVSAAVVTLMFAPYLIGVARRLSSLAEPRRRPHGQGPAANGEDRNSRSGHVVIVGCGPTGLQVVKALKDLGTPHLVLELNPRTVSSAAAQGTEIEYGDASRQDILLEAGVVQARALVITVPDPATATAIIEAARGLRPDLPIVARARYAQSMNRLAGAGADVLMNEEELVGERLAAASVEVLGLASEGLARVEPVDAPRPTAGPDPIDLEAEA